MVEMGTGAFRLTPQSQLCSRHDAYDRNRDEPRFRSHRKLATLMGSPARAHYRLGGLR